MRWLRGLQPPIPELLALLNIEVIQARDAPSNRPVPECCPRLSAPTSCRGTEVRVTGPTSQNSSQPACGWVLSSRTFGESKAPWQRRQAAEVQRALLRQGNLQRLLVGGLVDTYITLLSD